MKKLLALSVAALFAAIVHAADQLPLFNATLTIGKDHRFMLVSQPEGKQSNWLKLGDAFGGYALKSFDAKTNTLELERDGKISKISIMADAAVEKGGASTVTPATLQDAQAVMDKIHIDELLDRSIEVQKKMVWMSVERSMAGKVPENMKEDVAAFREKVMDEMAKLMDPAQMKADITKIYSETFSKEELNQISSFYDTPLGQTLLAKQPEIQQKMQSAMMPRMSELAPKLQQLGQEFGAQIKAKAAAAKAGGGGT